MKWGRQWETHRGGERHQISSFHPSSHSRIFTRSGYNAKCGYLNWEILKETFLLLVVVFPLTASVNRLAVNHGGKQSPQCREQAVSGGKKKKKKKQALATVNYNRV